MTDKTITFDSDELMLIGELISDAFENADSDEDAAELSELHVRLGFDPLVSEEGDTDEKE